MTKMAERTLVYRTEKENFDKEVFPYLESITEETKGEGRYNQIIKIKNGGLVHIVSSPLGIGNEVEGKIRIIAEKCSKKLQDNLNRLTKIDSSHSSQ